MKLKDRIALVTGAGSGMGRAIALELAREGARIGVNDIHPEGIDQTLDLLAAEQASGLALEADVSKVDQVKEMFNKLKATWRTIDLLVNNAGIIFLPEWESYRKLHRAALLKAVREMTRTGRMQESMKVTSSFEDEWWHTTLHVHLNGTFYCTREALKIMEEKGKGKIINMASLAGMCGSLGGVPAYSAAKGGIISFTKAVAREVIGSGIIVNAVAPGFVDTPFLDGLDEGVKKILQGQIPAGRFATEEEIAKLVTYLATDEANYIIGQIISPNGGIMM